MRLFVALDIEAAVRGRIAEFRDQMRALAPDVRWVGPETFHVTLQFLGETAKADQIQIALRQVKSSPVALIFRGAGFFPNPRSPRVFWVGIESGVALRKLVDVIGAALLPLGFEHDVHPYKPHLTLARSGSGRPRPVAGERAASGLRRVGEKLDTLTPPEFGTMTARKFFLYQSQLSPAGAIYSKIAEFPLA
jgi:2'-5' RNA ligase